MCSQSKLRLKKYPSLSSLLASVIFQDSHLITGKVLILVTRTFFQGSRILIAAEKGDLVEILGSMRAGIDVNYKDSVQRLDKYFCTIFQRTWTCALILFVSTSVICWCLENVRSTFILRLALFLHHEIINMIYFLFVYHLWLILKLR